MYAQTGDLQAMTATLHLASSDRMAVGSTRSKRRLGRHLRPLLDASGKKIEEVAREARCSRQTVSRLLSGEHLPRYHLFTALLAAIGVTGAERERAHELWEIADTTSVNVEYLGSLTPIYARFRIDESEAELERTIDTVLVSGLLQTPQYVKAVALGTADIVEGHLGRGDGGRRAAGSPGAAQS